MAIDFTDLMRKSAWGVDKSKIIDNNDTKDDEVGKSYGKAVYLEFREGSNTSQMLFVSECISPKTKAVVPMTYVSRQVSPAHDRRTWRIRPSKHTIGVKSTENPGRFQEMIDRDTVDAVSATMEDFRQYLSAMLNGNWKLYGKPLVVEVSAEDVTKIEEQGTPGALIRRIYRARVEAGFSEEIYNGN